MECRIWLRKEYCYIFDERNQNNLRLEKVIMERTRIGFHTFTEFKNNHLFSAFFSISFETFHWLNWTLITFFTFVILVSREQYKCISTPPKFFPHDILSLKRWNNDIDKGSHVLSHFLDLRYFFSPHCEWELISIQLWLTIPNTIIVELSVFNPRVFRNYDKIC